MEYTTQNNYIVEIEQWIILSLITMSSDYIFKVHHWQGLQISYKQLSSCWSVELLYICDLHTELGMGPQPCTELAAQSLHQVVIRQFLGYDETTSVNVVVMPEMFCIHNQCIVGIIFWPIRPPILK